VRALESTGSTDTLTDAQLVEVLQRYLTILQGHPSLREMMELILTEDFGPASSAVTYGEAPRRPAGLPRSAMASSTSHVIDSCWRAKRVKVRSRRTHLHFFLRRWGRPLPSVRSSLASAHTWRYAWSTAGGASQPNGGRFAELNGRLGAPVRDPEEGLNK
jgi:hypothetical protein